MKPSPLCPALFSFVVLLIVASAALAQSSVPPLINYQGRLLDAQGVPVATGDYELRFRLFDAATGGNAVWGPQLFDGTTGQGRGAKVSVAQGHFNIILGPVDTAGAAITDSFNAPDRYLEIQIGTNTPIAPRQRILSAPFAVRSRFADTATRLANDRTTDNLTIHVKPDGNDANDGLAENRAKKTIQAAINLVPERIDHPVEISIWPGTYRNQINIRNRRIANHAQGYLRLKGMGADPDAVRISGTTTSGELFSNLLNSDGSDVILFNLCFENSGGVAVSVSYRSNLSAVRCNLRNHPGSALALND